MPGRTNTFEAMKKLGLYSLDDGRLVSLLLHAFERTKDISNLDLRSLTTRSHAEGRKQLNTIVTNVSTVRNCFIYQSIECWNRLSNIIHEIEHKKQLKAFLFSNINGVRTSVRIGVG